MSHGGQNPNAGSREPFLLVIIATLFSLTVKSAFERSFEGLDEDYTIAQLQKTDWGTNALALCQLLVFLFSLVRFYLGAYRYVRETQGGENPGVEAGADFVGAILLFTGFYLASIAVRTAYLYYFFFLGFLILDLIWFWAAGQFFLKVSPKVSALVGLWQLFDLAIILPVSICFIFHLIGWPSWFSAAWARSIALLAILAVGIVDFIYLFPFYRGEPDWERRIGWVAKRLQRRDLA